VLLLARGRARVPPGDPRWLASDRAAGRVLALDAKLRVVAAHPVSSPRRVADGGQGIWVLAAGDASDPWPQQLLWLAPDGERSSEFSFQAVTDLWPLPRGKVLLVERVDGGDGIAWRVDRGGGVRLLSLPGASSVAGEGDRILVGCRGGEIVLAEETELGIVRAWRRLGAEPLDLAPGPRSGTWWVLTRAQELTLLASDLSVRWSCLAGSGACVLAAVPGRERVWVGGAGGLRCFGPGGVLELELLEPAGPGGCSDLAVAAGGALLATPGALLELRGSAGGARMLRSQGGFADLSCVARCGSPEPER
jgi:hypothetical protein